MGASLRRVKGPLGNGCIPRDAKGTFRGTRNARRTDHPAKPQVRSLSGRCLHFVRRKRRVSRVAKCRASRHSRKTGDEEDKLPVPFVLNDATLVGQE